jgi:MFS family permease
LRGFVLIRASWALAAQMLNVAVGWYIYSLTGSAMSLAYVGLAQFAPNLLLALVAGQAADRLDRRQIIIASLLAQAACAAIFAVLSAVHSAPVWPAYLLLALLGAARAFSAPAMAALLPSLVSAAEFPRAVAIGSSAFQIATIVGPAVGGLVYAISGTGMFALTTVIFLASLTQVGLLSALSEATTTTPPATADEGVLAGIRYVASNHLLLGAISLDLFAVLLGGVTALLPIYAKDILAVGPAGLGYLRSAPGIGAAAVGLLLAHRAIGGKAGRTMLACVAGYGVATIVFAISTNVWLSVAAMVALGGCDMVSVVIRQTLVQLSTPDAMRGRVSAVNWVFIGASNQLGEFESGATAALFGTVPAALLGGFGTLAIVGLWGWAFPELRRADRLDQS